VEKLTAHAEAIARGERGRDLHGVFLVHLKAARERQRASADLRFEFTRRRRPLRRMKPVASS
jgi:hypothetical protein